MTRRGFDTRSQIAREVMTHLEMFKGRSVLALLGIAIGTAAVIAMLHVGHNARVAALRQFDTLGTDQVSMQPQSDDRSAPVVSLASILDLPQQNIGIGDVSAIIQYSGAIRAGRSQIQIIVMAATDDIYAIGKARLQLGRLTSDIDGFSPFAVIGSGIATDIASTKMSPVTIGEKITVNMQILTVIGVLEDTPASPILGMDFNRSIVIPFAAARRMIPSPSITNIAARLSPGADDVRTAQAVSQYFDRQMLSGTMYITTARQLIASIEEQMRIYATLILGIGAVSLVVGGVGIMNVMLMSVMERRQEIGLRLALGARSGDIRLMFLCETLILSTIGSAIGTAIGYVAGWMFARGSGWQFEPAPLALPLGGGMALVVGLFFGIYPASRAARLDPVAALRGE